jgi:hypothetical protein
VPSIYTRIFLPLHLTIYACTYCSVTHLPALLLGAKLRKVVDLARRVCSPPGVSQGYMFTSQKYLQPTKSPL